MIFGSFICPVCGRNTKLLPPTKNTLKERFGVNIDGVEYYCPSTVKLFPRTVIPKQLYIDYRKPNNDNYIVPTVDLYLTKIKGTKLRFCHLSNIYSVSIEGQLYYLYVVNKTKSLIEIHICGDEATVSDIKQYFRNAMETDKSIIELHFEGKYAGAAEVCGIVD